MRLLWSAVVAAGLLTAAPAAFAQSNPSAPATPTDPAAAVPVAATKRFACQAATQGFKGQDKRDQMQLCMAQARLDCLKQAIDQKLRGRIATFDFMEPFSWSRRGKWWHRGEFGLTQPWTERQS